MENITIDSTKGVDLMRGFKVLKHYATIAEAEAAMQKKPGTYIRYWEKK